MKSATSSKTIWINILTLVAGVAGYVAGAEVMQDYAGVLPIFIAVQSGIGIVLRFLTTEPIK